MSSALATRNSAVALKPESQTALAEAHARFFGAMANPKLSEVDRMLATAQATIALRAAFSGEVFEKIIKPLAGNPLGFDTDQDSAYPDNVIRDCAIAAWVHGLPFVGNFWNIIGKRMYPRKEGYELLCQRLVQYTVQVTVDPVYSKMYESGGYVPCSVVVSYREHGASEKEPAKTMSRTYSVRLTRKNSVAVDYLAGKATRKALRDLYGVLTGVLLGDADDVADQAVAESPATKPVANSVDALKSRVKERAGTAPESRDTSKQGVGMGDTSPSDPGAEEAGSLQSEIEDPLPDAPIQLSDEEADTIRGYLVKNKIEEKDLLLELGSEADYLELWSVEVTEASGVRWATADELKDRAREAVKAILKRR